MCEPTTISLVALGVGAAASAAGTYMQYEGTQQAARAQNDATTRAMAAARAETQRQEDIANRSRAIAGEVAQQAGPDAMAGRLQHAEETRQAGLEQAVASDPNRDRLMGGQDGASSTVRTIISDRRAEAAAKMAREAVNRARLGSWGDAFVNLGETTAPLMDRINMQGSFARGSSGALGVETAAQEKIRELGAYRGAGLRALGSGVSAIGNSVSSNAGSIGGWFAPSAGGAKGATDAFGAAAATAKTQMPGLY